MPTSSLVLEMESSRHAYREESMPLSSGNCLVCRTQLLLPRCYHSQPHSQRMWSHRLIFLRTRLHTAQHRIHMWSSFLLRSASTSIQLHGWTSGEQAEMRR